MIIDVITYNGEEELFEIRYNILKDYVDEFRVIEFDKTFSGEPKGPVFTQNWPKVKSYYMTEDIWSKYIELAKSSPNTEYGKGAEHWVREFCQKESIKDCLTDLKSKNIVYVGDCDEIPNPLFIMDEDLPIKLKLKVYSYYLNNRSTEQFWGTLVARYSNIENNCLNHLRTNTKKTDDDYGWHFTSMGGYQKVKDKLEASYTSDSYANPYVLDNLYDNMQDNRDFLGRDFAYKIDESWWPKYLIDNRDKYKHLLKHE